MSDYDEDGYAKSCPHDSLSEQWLDEAGWLHDQSSVWYEVWRQECGDCGAVWEHGCPEVRIEVTALEEMLMEHAA